MKLKDAKDIYYYFSETTSKIVRQLGFAGIAIVWIFKAETNGRQIIPSELIPATIMIIIGLTFDLLHYVSGTLVWGLYHRHKEKEKVGEKNESLAPKQINWATIFFFWAKTIMMCVAYISLLSFLISKVF